jgi:toxin FitB
VARVVLDTNVASLVYKDALPRSLADRLTGCEPCLTFVTVGELAKWSAKRRWGRSARVALARWIDTMAVLPYDHATAWRWGRISTTADRRGRRREDNDIWIAAVCLATRLPLATRNVRDFVDFAEHEGLVLVTE